MKYIIHVMERQHMGEDGYEQWNLVDLPDLMQVKRYAGTLSRNLSIDKGVLGPHDFVKFAKKKKIPYEDAQAQLLKDNTYYEIYIVPEEIGSWRDMSKEYLADRKNFCLTKCRRINE